MKRDVQLALVSGSVVALAVIALGYLFLRGGPDLPKREIPVAKKAEPKGTPKKPVVDLAAGKKEPAKQAPIVVGERPPAVARPDIERQIEELLREYDAVVNDVDAGPDRVTSLRDRQQRLDKIVERLAALGPDAVPVLLKYLDGDPRRADLVGRQTIIIRAIALIPGKPSLDGLGRALEVTDSFALKMTIISQLAEHRGAPGIDILAQRLGVETDARVKGRILNYLGHSKSPEAVAIAARVARDDADPNVRSAAIRALGDANDASAGPMLEAIARDNTDVGCRQTAIQVYSRLVKETAIPTLEDLLRNDANLRIKAVAVLALQEVGGPRARAALEAAINDPTQGEDVRARARGALAALDREAQAAAGGVVTQPFDSKLERPTLDRSNLRRVGEETPPPR